MEARWRNAQYARQTAGKAGEICGWCEHVTKDDITWVHGAVGKACGVRNVGQRYSNNEYGCVITMQHTAEVNAHHVFTVPVPADVVVSATNHALTLANNVHTHHEESGIGGVCLKARTSRMCKLLSARV